MNSTLQDFRRSFASRVVRVSFECAVRSSCKRFSKSTQTFLSLRFAVRSTQCIPCPALLQWLRLWSGHAGWEHACGGCRWMLCIRLLHHIWFVFRFFVNYRLCISTGQINNAHSHARTHFATRPPNSQPAFVRAELCIQYYKLHWTAAGRRRGRRACMRTQIHWPANCACIARRSASSASSASRAGTHDGLDARKFHIRFDISQRWCVSRMPTTSASSFAIAYKYTCAWPMNNIPPSIVFFGRLWLWPCGCLLVRFENKSGRARAWARGWRPFIGCDLWKWIRDKVIIIMCKPV